MTIDELLTWGSAGLSILCAILVVALLGIRLIIRRSSDRRNSAASADLETAEDFRARLLAEQSDEDRLRAEAILASTELPSEAILGVELPPPEPIRSAKARPNKNRLTLDAAEEVNHDIHLKQQWALIHKDIHDVYEILGPPPLRIFSGGRNG